MNLDELGIIYGNFPSFKINQSFCRSSSADVLITKHEGNCLVKNGRNFLKTFLKIFERQSKSISTNIPYRHYISIKTVTKWSNAISFSKEFFLILLIPGRFILIESVYFIHYFYIRMLYVECLPYYLFCSFVLENVTQFVTIECNYRCKRLACFKN